MTHPADEAEGEPLEFTVSSGGVTDHVVTARRMCETVIAHLDVDSQVDVVCLNTGEEVTVDEVMDGVVVAGQRDDARAPIERRSIWAVILEKWLIEGRGRGSRREGPADRS